MATYKKITGLPAASSVLSTDLVEITHDPAGSPVSQKAAIGAIVTAGGGNGGLRGIGSPQGVQSAPPGTTYYNGDGTGGFWVKDTGTGNTGWIQLL